MLKPTLTTTLASLLFAGGLPALADPAIYTNGTMTIPEGAVVSPEGNAYFTDIALEQDAEGHLAITSATSNSLVYVDAIDVQVMESFPLQVNVAVDGNLSVPCVELLSPAVSYADNTFTVVLAESNLGPAETCITMLEPFSTTVPLDLFGLEAGTYTVTVNGVEGEFTLDADTLPHFSDSSP